MTRLSKDYIIEIVTPGTAGTPGLPGVPARAGYWVDRSPVPAIIRLTPGPAYSYTPPTPPQGQYIRRAAQAETRLIPSLRPFYDNYAADASKLQALEDEWYRSLVALQNSGSLGIPLAMLSSPYPAGTYIAAWNDSSGTWFSIFYGFTDRPSQTIVN